MATPFHVALRMPRSEEPVSLTTRGLGGRWLMSARGLCEALVDMSKPETLDTLARGAGSQAMWSGRGPVDSVEWVDAGWPDSGNLSFDQWKQRSIDGMEQGWALADGSPRVQAWDEGGWLWSPAHGCWLMQTFVLSSGSRAVEAMRLQPAALTFWQWDKDPFNEDMQGTLFSPDLERMAAGMSFAGLDLLIKGLGSAHAVAAPTMARLSALMERAILDQECAEGSGESGQGTRRL